MRRVFIWILAINTSCFVYGNKPQPLFPKDIQITISDDSLKYFTFPESNQPPKEIDLEKIIEEEGFCNAIED